MEQVRVLAEDKGLEKLLGAPVPSRDALLDFIGQFHDPNCLEDRPPQKKAWVPPESEGLRALDAINREVVARGAERSVTQATIDHDGTIIEAHKRDAADTRSPGFGKDLRNPEATGSAFSIGL